MTEHKTTRCPALHERGNDRRLWKAMVAAAQATVVSPCPEEYGLSDADMEKAIRAALAEIEKRNGRR